MHFNTAISRIMELVNELVPYSGEDSLNQEHDLEFLAEAVDNLILLFAPFAPHTSEELWREVLAHEKSVFLSQWPSFDPRILIEDIVTVVIQINGKLRSQIQIPRDLPEDEVIGKARSAPKVAGYFQGKEIRKVIHVPNKLVNFVVG